MAPVVGLTGNESVRADGLLIAAGLSVARKEKTEKQGDEKGPFFQHENRE